MYPPPPPPPPPVSNISLTTHKGCDTTCSRALESAQTETEDSCNHQRDPSKQCSECVFSMWLYTGNVVSGRMKNNHSI